MKRFSDLDLSRPSFLRRGLLRGAAALACCRGSVVLSHDPRRTNPLGRGPIDVHHHVFPAPMIEELKSVLPAFSLPSVVQSLAQMQAGGTSTAMISYPNYDILSLEEGRLTALLRAANDDAIELTHAHSGRYG